MVSQIQTNRVSVTDRLAMLAFTIRTDGGPRVAEVVIATDPALFSAKDKRNSGNFYSSREHGFLTIPRGQAVYVVRPDVLARFIHADRLYFALATATPPAASDWTVDVLPTVESPYVSLSGLTDRALRRVRMFPSRSGTGYGKAGVKSVLEWAGDNVPSPPQAARAAPAPNPAAAPPASAAPPQNLPYDDGFGPLPPLQAAAEAPPAPVAAQQAVTLAKRPRALTAADYSGVTKLMPSPAYNSRDGTAIDRIVIHITDAGQTPYIGSSFTGEDAKVSAHYMVDQNGDIIQFVREQDRAWHAESANSRSIGIEHVAVKQGGARYGNTTYPYTPPTDAEYRASAELVAHLCRKYGLTPDRTTIIGHSEAQVGTSHARCPDGAWDWDGYMALVAAYYAALPAAQGLGQDRAKPAARTLGAGATKVEIKYRVFIPAPLIEGPNSGYDLGPIASGEDFSGDNRGFSYDQGTSRAEIVATLMLDDTGAMSDLRTVRRSWGESKAYDSTYTYHVEGKPDWWMDKQAGLQPLRRGTLAVTDDNLSIAQGAPGSQRSIAAMAMQASVVTINVAGALPLISPSPDIDADISIYLKRGPGGDVLVMVAGDHDGFPCHELYVNRQQVYTYDPVGAGASPNNLFPPNDREVATDWLTVAPLASGQSLGLGHDARTLDTEDWSINWDDVFPVGQPTNMSCWATAAAMIDGWKRRQSVSVESIATFDNLSTSNGLPPASAARFADAIGFTVNPNACYTPEGFRDLLEANGPIWVAAKVPGLHAIVVTGMYRQDGQYYVRITDPWDRVVGQPGAPGAYAATHATGSQYILTYDAFAAEFEAAGDTDFAQLLHTGGAQGHAINRGSAAPAGYALGRARALDADDWTINWDEVQRTPQPTDMSCWATAAAMLVGWRDRQSVSPALLAQYNGLTSSLTSGLAPGDKAAFARALGLVVHPNACYTPEGFRDVIEANGPIWVTAKVPGVHAILVTGMYRQDGAYYVRITDPWDRVVGAPGQPGAYADTHVTGSQYIMTYEAFTAEFEAAGDIDRIQLLHCGGAFDHAINRGNAGAAGYALALGDTETLTPPPLTPAAPAPVAAPAGDPRLGMGTSLTRATIEKNGRRYDLAQLSGFVEPQNGLAGGAGMSALPGERVVLDDWPYIEGPSGRTQAGVAIDWKYRSGAVGDIAVTPIDGQVLDGWSATVFADIAPNGSTPNRASLKVRVTTTFTRAGEEDQVAVTDVTLSGEGRQTTVHGADRAPEPALPDAVTQPQRVTA